MWCVVRKYNITLSVIDKLLRYKTVFLQPKPFEGLIPRSVTGGQASSDEAHVRLRISHRVPGEHVRRQDLRRAISRTSRRRVALERPRLACPSCAPNPKIYQSSVMFDAPLCFRDYGRLVASVTSSLSSATHRRGRCTSNRWRRSHILRRVTFDYT